MLVQYVHGMNNVANHGRGIFGHPKTKMQPAGDELGDALLRVMDENTNIALHVLLNVSPAREFVILCHEY